MFPRNALAALLALASILSHWVAPAAARADAPCYDPAGVVVPGYFPCDATAYITNCCSQGWTCFSNALCVVTTESNAFPNLTLGEVVRGMCTNPQWNNQICGDRCLNGDNINGDLVYCGDHRFCCLGDWNAGLCTCDAGSKAFVINDGKAQTIVGVTDTTFSGTPSIATTRPTPKPQSSTTRSSTPASTPASTTPSGAGPTNTNPPDGDGGGGGSSNNGLKIGLGVGIPVVVLGVAAAAAFFLWWRPRQRDRHTPYTPEFDRTPAEEGTAVQQAMARDSFYPPPRVGADRDNPFLSGDSH